MIRKGYKPGDNLAVCDISGFVCYQSELVRTWDGLKVLPQYWYERHPQLDVKGVPERSMAVIDGRSEQSWKFAYPDFGSGPLIVAVPSLAHIFKVVVSNAGTVSTVLQPWQPAPPEVIIGGYKIVVDYDGPLSTEAADETGYLGWMLVSPNGRVWNLTTPAGVITATAV